MFFCLFHIYSRASLNYCFLLVFESNRGMGSRSVSKQMVLGPVVLLWRETPIQSKCAIVISSDLGKLLHVGTNSSFR